MVAGAFGSCIDLHATWTKGFDANNCPIVTFSSNKEGLEDCDVAVGPYLKTVTVNGNEMNVSELLADINFEYVPYDQATHVPGPLLGTGTPADPFQVPVKECNFVFVDYDPDEHIEGQPVEGSGTAVDPWQIPVKQCNFEYVPYEPVIHDEGVIEGDGTEDNPWQIPFKECNFNYVPYDPEIHDYDDPIEGDGTTEDPWQIPVKECNFEYVAYNPAIHTFGSIAGDGTAADPWQIPLFELDSDVKICAVRIVNTPVGGQNVYSFEYDLCDKDDNVVDTLVAANVPVPTFSDKQGNPLVGDIELLVPSDFVDRGNNYYEAAGLQGINSAGECELFSPPTWAYVPYNPATHSGPLQGAGTTADPFELPVTPEKECNFQYVDFDETIHGQTQGGDSPIVGDGTVGNPWQIPRPCCEQECDPIVIESTAVTDVELCTTQLTTFDIEATVLNRGSFGDRYEQDGSSLIPVAGSIPIPAATPGCLLVLHLITGGDEQFGSLNNNWLNQAALSAPAPAGNLAPLTLLAQQTGNFEWDHSLWVAEVQAGAAGSAITITFPNETQGTDPLQGVVNWHWTQLCRTDGNPLLQSDLGPVVDQIYTGTMQQNTDIAAYNYETDANCPAVMFVGGRHVDNLNTDTISEITDSEWVSYTTTAGTAVEGYDTVSGERPGAGGYLMCQLGMSMAYLAPATTVTVQTQHNISSGNPAVDWNGSFALPVICEKTECVASQPPSVEEFTLESPGCDREFTKDVQGQIEFTLEGSSGLTATPVINGTSMPGFSVSASASGVVPFSFSHNVGTIPADGSTNCSLTWELVDDNGDELGGSAQISSNITITGA